MYSVKAVENNFPMTQVNLIRGEIDMCLVEAAENNFPMTQVNIFKSEQMEEEIIVCDSCHCDVPKSATQDVVEQGEIFCFSCYDEWKNDNQEEEY